MAAIIHRHSECVIPHKCTVTLVLKLAQDILKTKQPALQREGLRARSNVAGNGQHPVDPTARDAQLAMLDDKIETHDVVCA